MGGGAAVSGSSLAHSSLETTPMLVSPKSHMG
jgi:hypothetical protein